MNIPKIFRQSIPLVVVFSIGYISRPFNFQCSSQSKPIPSPTPLNAGLDNFEIQFSGNQGESLYANYSISPPPPPIETEEIRDTLPYKVNFSAPKASSISAGASPNKGLEVKIFRNGIECGVSSYSGLYANASKICRRD